MGEYHCYSRKSSPAEYPPALRLGIFSHMKHAHEVLLVRCSSMGDILLTLPAVQLLHDSCPDIRITYACYSRWIGLLRCLPALDRSMALPFHRIAESLHRGRFCRSIYMIKKIRRRLRSGMFDTAVDLHNTTDSALAVLWSGAPVRAGHRRQPLSRSFSCRFDFAGDNISATVHASRLAAMSMAAAGLPVDPDGALPFPRFRFPEQITANPLVRLAEQEQPVLLFPFASREEKSWPAAHFEQLALQLEEHGQNVWICGDARHRGRLQPMAAGGRRCIVNPPLPLLLRLTASARLIIGNDSGPLHAAGLLQRPGVAVYTCANLHKFAPFSSSITPVAVPAPCRPCTPRQMRRCRNRICREIPTAKVWEAVRTKLDKAGV